MCRAKCVQLNIYTPQEKGIVQKSYTLIYYTWKIHLYAVSHSPSLMCSLMWEAALGTQPCHINMRTGEKLPLFPHATVTKACSSGIRS